LPIKYFDRTRDADMVCGDTFVSKKVFWDKLVKNKPEKARDNILFFNSLDEMVESYNHQDLDGSDFWLTWAYIDGEKK